MQNQTSSALHNAIMEASGKDRPPMLAPDVNATPVTPSNEGTSQPQQPRGSCSNHSYGIDNDIYSTVDVCPNAIEMWKAIERLKQVSEIRLDTPYGDKWIRRIGVNFLGVRDKIKSFKIITINHIKCVSLTDEQLCIQRIGCSGYAGSGIDHYAFLFVTIVKQSQDLKNVSYHKLYDILNQHQNEVNEIRAERLARTANSLALVAQQQLVYHPQPNPTNYTQSSSTRSQVLAKNRGKAISNSSPPTYDLEPEVVADDDTSSKEKEIDKLMALISMYFKKIYKPTNNNLRILSNTRNLNVDNTLKSSRGTGYDRQTGHRGQLMLLGLGQM
ncbi:hypothetical protein Tco_1330780 [Tanacetum coccineum]